MMLFLFRDVFHYTRHLRFADGKRAVALLPIKQAFVLLHPNGAVAFDVADKIADIYRFTNRDQKVAMICRAVTDDKFRFIVLDDAVNVRIQARFNFRVDKIDAVLCREDHVYQYLDQ